MKWLLKMFLEKAYIWTEWGACNKQTCTQRRKRKCKYADKCKGSDDDDRDKEAGITKDHSDYVEAEWEKFDRQCTDIPECFAPVDDDLTKPLKGKFIRSI